MKCSQCGTADGANLKRLVRKMRRLCAFFVLIVITVSLTACGAKLGEMDMVPELPGESKILANNKTLFVAEASEVSQETFLDFIEACKEKGFTRNENNMYTNEYRAFNESWCELSIEYDVDNNKMSVMLARMIDKISWPKTAAGKQLPVPKSLMGTFKKEENESLSVMIVDVTVDDYREYVQACSEKGFTINQKEEERYMFNHVYIFTAENDAGWNVTISCNDSDYAIMSIDIEKIK